MSAVAGYPREIQTSQASNPSASTDSPYDYVDVDYEADWDLTDLNAAEGMVAHIFLKLAFRKLLETCHRAEVPVLPFMIDVADIALERVSDFVVGDVSSNDALGRSAKVSVLQ